MERAPGLVPEVDFLVRETGPLVRDARALEEYGNQFVYERARRSPKGGGFIGGPFPEKIALPRFARGSPRRPREGDPGGSGAFLIGEQFGAPGRYADARGFSPELELRLTLALMGGSKET